MSSSVIFLVLFALVFYQMEMDVAQLLDESCRSKNNFKIVGGKPAPINSRHWMAAIYNRTKDFNCGGTLITKNHVLTAAHCIINQEVLYVRLGEYYILCNDRQCSDRNWLAVVKAVIHVDFKFSRMLNDIGLLQLQNEVNYNANIRPICIVLDKNISSVGIETFSAFGWGRTHPDNPDSSPILNTVSLARRSAMHCLQRGDIRELSDKLICAGSDKGDTCGGDSGGPLVANLPYRGESVAVQVGIVSYGSMECNSNGAYTDVMQYKDWMRTIIGPTTKIQQLFYEKCGSTWSGGIDVLHFEVSVINRNFTGSLITDRFVITVASAFLRNPTEIKVKSVYFTSFDVKAVIRHREFGTSPMKDNIAIIELSKPVPISHFITTICLDLNMNARTSLTAILYSTNKDVLGAQKVHFDQISSSECSKMIQLQLQPSQFCVTKPRSDFKFHLPGSVLGTYDTINNDKKFLLLGMISFIKNDLIVFTNVTSYKDWIRLVTKTQQ